MDKRNGGVCTVYVYDEGTMQDSPHSLSLHFLNLGTSAVRQAFRGPKGTRFTVIQLLCGNFITCKFDWEYALLYNVN